MIALASAFGVAVSCVFGGSPGEFEQRLADGQAIVIAVPVAEPEPCGADDWPAVVTLEIEEGLLEEAPWKEVSVVVPLVGSGGEVPLTQPAEAGLFVLRDLEIDDGAGCAHVPPLAAIQVLGADLSLEARDSWRKYARAARNAPAAGPALEHTLVHIWLDTLDAADEWLRRHAARSLECWAARGSVAVALLERLIELMLSDEPEKTQRVAGRLLGLISSMDPSSLTAGPDGRCVATLAREALLGGLNDERPRVRALAVQALSSLYADGDESVSGALSTLMEMELKREVWVELEASVGPRAAPESKAAATSDEEWDLGLRMLLVLFGLFALLGLAFLPILTRRGQGLTGDGS